MILFSGNPFSHAFFVTLYSLSPFGLFTVNQFPTLHHTLVGCMAFARMIDAISPYLVGCVGR